MDITNNQYCFVCGRNNPIGFKAAIEVDRQAQTAQCTVTIPTEFQGWQGMVHGGIISALLDEMCAHAGMTVAENIVTGELKTRYRKPVPVETPVTVTGRVVSHVRRAVLVEAELTVAGEVCASGEAKMMVVRAAT